MSELQRIERLLLEVLEEMRENRKLLERILDELGPATTFPASTGGSVSVT